MDTNDDMNLFDDLLGESSQFINSPSDQIPYNMILDNMQIDDGKLLDELKDFIDEIDDNGLNNLDQDDLNIPRIVDVTDQTQQSLNTIQNNDINSDSLFQSSSSSSDMFLSGNTTTNTSPNSNSLSGDSSTYVDSPQPSTSKGLSTSPSCGTVANKGRICQVCGNEAGKHSYYGGQVCNSCRAFFRRAVQSQGYNNFKCNKGGNCEINSRCCTLRSC